MFLVMVSWYHDTTFVRATCAKQRKAGDNSGYERTAQSPSELGFCWYPQVTETTQDGFTRLRSWVRVPQRPPCCTGHCSHLTYS